VIWNIGQGQWVTSIEDSTCRHFDVGGERFPWAKISKLCRDKRNKVYLSHWDWDHIGGLAKWPSSWDTCIAMRPQGTSSPGKMKLLEKFSDCPEKPDLPIWRGPTLFKKSRKSKNEIDTNAASQVVTFKRFLLPGDSPVKAEKVWQSLPWITNSKVLVLGHHGSRTSTSEELLDHLPHLQMAIASARWERYKHPHAEVVYRLKKRRIPLLKTEDWGNIWFE
jgi:competence protein ComEC